MTTSWAVSKTSRQLNKLCSVPCSGADPERRKERWLKRYVKRSAKCSVPCLWLSLWSHSCQCYMSPMWLRLLASNCSLYNVWTPWRLAHSCSKNQSKCSFYNHMKHIKSQSKWFCLQAVLLHFSEHQFHLSEHRPNSMCSDEWLPILPSS